MRLPCSQDHALALAPCDSSVAAVHTRAMALYKQAVSTSCTKPSRHLLQKRHCLCEGLAVSRALHCRSLTASDGVTLSSTDWAAALGDSVIPLVSGRS